MRFATMPDQRFDYWWGRRGIPVEPENVRRHGNSGVLLLSGDRATASPPLYCKRQCGHLYHSVRHPFGRPTIMRELQAYRAIARVGIRLPHIIYGGIRRHAGQWQAVLVTQALHGFTSLDRWYADNPDEPSRRAVMQALAGTLVRLHRARWQHGCCYPKHLFVRVVPDACGRPLADIALLDLEKCRRRLSGARAARHDMAQLARHWGSIPTSDLALLQKYIAGSFVGSIPQNSKIWPAVVWPAIKTRL